MRLRLYVCPECDAYHESISAVILGPGIRSIKCPDCGFTETLNKNKQAGAT